MCNCPPLVAFALIFASVSCGTARPSDEIDGLWIGNFYPTPDRYGAHFIMGAYAFVMMASGRALA